MSIAKVGKSKSSASAIDYVLKEENGEKKPKIISGNVLGSTKQEIKNEFQFQENFNPKAQNTVTHISISFTQKTEITDEFAAEYADNLMDELGYSANPYLVVRHYDKDHRQSNSYSHIHIVASRINDDGSLIPEWKNAEKIIAATKKIDQKLDLESVEFVKNEGERNIKPDEYRVMQQGGKLSVMEQFKDVAEASFYEIGQFKTKQTEAKNPRKIIFFVEKIQAAGFEVLPNLDEKNEKMRGFSFKKDSIIFTASAAGKPFAWRNLAEKLDYETAEDYKFLVELRAETLIAKDQVSIKTEQVFAKIGQPNEAILVNPNIEERPINEVKINEKTDKFANETDPKPIGKRVFETAKEAKEFEKPRVAMAKTIRREPNSSVEKIKIVGGESAAIREHRNDNQTVGSGAITETNRAKTTAKVGGNFSKIERISDNGEEKTAPLGNTNPRQIRNFDEFDERHQTRKNKTESANFRDENLHSGKEKSGGELRKIFDSNRKTQTEQISISEPERPHIVGNTDEGELKIRNDNSESGRTNDKFGEREITTKQKDNSVGNSNKIFSKTDGGGEKTSKKRSLETSRLGRTYFAENFGGVNSAIDNSLDDNVLLLDDKQGLDPEFAGGAKRKSGVEATISTISRRDEETPKQRELFDDQAETTVSRSRKVFPTSARDSTENDSGIRPSNRQTAETVIQIINVRYFSTQLDTKTVQRWTELIENSNSNEFLEEIIKPKTDQESECLLNNISKQSELIADSLNQPKPQIIVQIDSILLNQTLTKIEVENYQKATGDLVNEKIIEILCNEKNEEIEIGQPTLEQENYLKNQIGKTDFPIFSSDLEVEVFKALLNPDEVKFDENQISEVKEFVQLEEVAAIETVNLIQLAYGGQNEIFTEEFKSNLAEQIYYGASSNVDLYHQFNDFNWQKTINYFSPLVDNFASNDGIIVQPPTDEKEKNLLLASYFTDKMADVFEANLGQLPDSLQRGVFNCVGSYANCQVQENQINFLSKLKIDDLEPPTFNHALEAQVYIFEKLDENAQLQMAENLVEFVSDYQDARIQKQVEIQNQPNESIQLSM